jgi:eukaryotic-like serine/threonine-protein kinase
VDPTLILSQDGAPYAPPAPPPSAGRYELGTLLGSGGMADVYRATDSTLGRAVALKFLRAIDVDQTERFMREARAQAHVEHPNICKVYEVGNAGGRPFIAMQCIEGMTLAQAAAHMPLDAKVAVMADVADAVHAAHRVGLVHRDLKPGNIMLEETDDGRRHPYVLDFGLARDQESSRLTTIGVVMGTPSYMAPEQARGDRQRIDRRTDVYGLGATLYELLTGRPPFDGDTSMAVLMQLMQDDPTPPRALDASIPADLETVVLKCLEKDPQRRYDSARALADDLRRYLDGEPIAARRAGIVHKLATRARRHPTMAALLAVAVVAVLASISVALVTAYRSMAVAAAAQRFGQDVERIEAIARYAHMLPLHDTGRERTLIRQRIDAIAEARRTLGRAAEGPAQYAIGRGELALGDDAASRQHLEAAWRAGYRAPQVAYALGRAIGAQYEAELKDAERIANKDARERRRKTLEHDYRDPALAYLRQSSGTAAESPAYAVALIAFYEKRYDDALRQARAAAAQVPWLYEAKELEGDVLTAMALADNKAGRYDEALRGYDAAGAAYAAAARIAPSDASAFLGDADRWSHTMKLEVDRGGDPAPALQHGLAAASVAAIADPAGGESFRTRALLLIRYGEWQVLHGVAPLESFDRAIEAASHAIALRGDDAKAYSNVGQAYFDKARYAVTHGQDPFPLYDASIRANRRAVELAPRDPILLSNLANALRRDAEAQHNRGVDAGGMLAESIAVYDRAVAADPEWANSWNDRSLAFLTRGEWETAAGTNPMASLAEAVRSGERAAQLNPKLPASFVNLSVAHWDRGDYLLRHGGDPRAEVDAAAAASGHAAALNPKIPSPHENAAEAYALEAEYAFDNGQDAHPWVVKMLDETSRALAIDPAHVSSFGTRAQAYYFDRQYASAREALAQAMKLNPNDGELLLLGARIELAAGDLAKAQALAERAIGVNAKSVDAWTVRAEIARQRGDAAGGLSAVQKALALNRTDREALKTRDALAASPHG